MALVLVIAAAVGLALFIVPRILRGRSRRARPEVRGQWTGAAASRAAQPRRHELVLGQSARPAPGGASRPHLPLRGCEFCIG